MLGWMKRQLTRSLHSSAKAKRRPNSRKFRPAVEELESRLTPSITIDVPNNFQLDPSKYAVWVAGTAQPTVSASNTLGNTNVLEVLNVEPGSPATASFTPVEWAIQSAQEASGTVTITTISPHGLQSGDQVFISGVGVAGYNGIFQVLGGANAPTSNTFQYSDSATGLLPSAGGAAANSTLIEPAISINAAPNGATSSGDQVTITTKTPHGLTGGATVVISGFTGGAANFNGTFEVNNAPLTANSFTYTDTNISAIPIAGGAIPGASDSTSGGVNTVTITTTSSLPTGLQAGDYLMVAGVGNSAYDGTFQVLSTGLTTTTFEYNLPNGTPKLPNNGGGTVQLDGGGGSVSSVGVPVISLSSLPVDPNTNLPSFTLVNSATGSLAGARLTVFVSPIGQPPAPISTGGSIGTGLAPASIPPLAPNATNIGPPSDIMEFAYLAPLDSPSGSDSTFDVSQVNGFGMPLTLQATVTGGPSTVGVSQSASFAFNRADIGSDSGNAYAAFMKNDPQGSDYAELLYNKAIPTSAAITSVSEAAGGIVTVQTSTAHRLQSGDPVTIAGVANASYNGTFTVLSSGLAPNTFQYNDPILSLPNSSGGTASGNIFVTPPLVNGQTYVLADPNDWLTNQGAISAASDPLSSYWDSTLTNFFQVGNQLSINLSTGTPNIYSGGTAGVVESATPTGGGLYPVTVTLAQIPGIEVKTGDSVTLSGVGVASYNGPFTVMSKPTANTFTFLIGTGGLAPSGGGTVKDNTTTAVEPIGEAGAYTLSNGTNVYTFSNPGTGVAGADYVFGQKFATAPAADQGLLQDNIWEALCRGVALDGVFASSVTNGQSTTAWNANASGTDNGNQTFQWYTQHTPTQFAGFNSVYDTFAKFLHYSDLSGLDSRTSGNTPIFIGNAAYGFSEDENPLGPYTGGEVPAKLDGTVSDGQTMTLTVDPWEAPPVVTGVSPSSGPTSGGTPVTVTGFNFQTATEVDFGSAKVLKAQFTVNAGGASITLFSPPHAAKTVDVTVISDDGTSAKTPADQFTYVSSNPPASITATAGSGQSAVVNTAFVTNLQAIVKDQNGSPVAGVTVVFTAPSSGPAGAFTGGTNTISEITNSNGVAAAPTFTANLFAGTYTVTAFVSGVASPANFTLTNLSPLGTSTNAIYVENVYALLLNRVADLPGGQYWVNQLNGGAAPSTMVQGIEQSTEYRQDVVEGLYLHYLQRAADSSGLNYFVSVLAGGGTIEQVTAGLISGSLEYFQLHGSNNTQFLVALYQDILNRTVSGSGSEVQGWLTVLAGGTSRTQVALDFLTSHEYRVDLLASNTCTPADPSGCGYYPEFLLRPADTVGLDYFLGQLNAGVSDQAVLAAILGSGEGYGIWS